MAGRWPALARLAPLLLAGCALQGCATNPLAAIDGPYIPPSQRAAAAAAAAQAAPPSPPAASTVAAETPAAAVVARPPVPAAELAYPDESFVGPVLTRPEMDELGTSPPAEQPAAGSLSQPQPIANDARAGDGAAYGRLHRFVLGRLAQPGQRESMLLAKPEDLDPALSPCPGLPAAVLIDLDPAGVLLPLAGPLAASPELAGYLRQFRERGVRIYWITGHGPGEAGAIRQALRASDLDPTGDDPLVVSRFAAETKQNRRRALGETDCLLAILGDQMSDFDELYDYLRDPALAAPLDRHLDNGWFLAPPPLNPALQPALLQQEANR